MARPRKRELVEADRFHAALVLLLGVRHADWTEWEGGWLEDEARRTSDYVYTDTEREILNQLIAGAKTFTHYAGYSVQELFKGADRYRTDFDEGDEEFLEQLNDWRATDLKVRQISRLASLYRLHDSLERDSEIEDTVRATRKRDSSEYRLDEGDGLGHFA